MASTKKNDRIFDPFESFGLDDFDLTAAFSREDIKALMSAGPQSVPILPTLRNCLVLSVACASSNQHSTKSAKVSYSVYFGPKSPFNLNGQISGANQTSQAAELFAMKEALDLAKLWAVQGAKFLTIAVCTHSQYLTRAFTEQVWTWAKREYKDGKGKELKNKDMIKDIHEIMMELEGKNIKVQMWLVSPKRNEHAIELAQERLEEESTTSTSDPSDKAGSQDGDESASGIPDGSAK